MSKQTFSITVPKKDELSVYYSSYLKYVPESDLLKALDTQTKAGLDFFESITEEQAELMYAPGKWKLKEILGHLCDTERILSYRALCFARNDRGPLPGFDENDYVRNSEYGECNYLSIREEHIAVRNASLSLFRNLTSEAFTRKGIANEQEHSVAALLFFIVAHERHHIQVIIDRYLKS